MNKNINIIKICGLISALTVVIVSFWSNTDTKEILDYIIIAAFALFAFVPFAILAHIAKKNSVHGSFFMIFGLLLITFDLYAKYDAMIVSESSTSSLVMVTMPIFLSIAILILLVGYVIFIKITKEKEDDIDQNETIKKQ